MIDLEVEFAAARRALTPRHRALLREVGVADEIVDAFPVVGVAKIGIGEDTYAPDDAGGEAFIVAARIDPLAPAWEVVHPLAETVVRCGEIADLVAFTAAAPLFWQTRRGTATWLGAARASLDRKPVPVWESPLAWLRSGCTGIVPLVHDPHELQLMLLRLPAIVAQDAAHGRALQGALSRPAHVPPIFVATRN